MSTARGPGQRAGLSRAQVLEAARDVLGDGGVDRLSVRAVARQLGVAPNALYSHVTDRDDLLDAVLDDVLGDVDVPSASRVARDPVGAIRTLMLSSYDVLIAHPGLMAAYFDRQGARGVNAQRLGAVTLEAFDRAGVEPDRAREGLRVLIVTTMGFAAITARPDSADPGRLGRTELRRNYRNGLDWLLEGITAGARRRRPGATR